MAVGYDNVDVAAATDLGLSSAISNLSSNGTVYPVSASTGNLALIVLPAGR